MIYEDIIRTIVRDTISPGILPEEINHECGKVFLKLLKENKEDFVGVKIESVIASIRDRVATICHTGMTEAGATSSAAIQQIAFYTGFTAEGMRIIINRMTNK